ncbi:hypothetical protein EUGRSUZ_C00476 [Eucalyptus grandis]|uniref:Uncharacterized protein n=2 Tax=Eucalyptus grandis TaxID=71139 RepID=A0ACC3L9V4_EUCGR|nr:hypothetical protein EUGRSUZ_C00476 [Eucalyptus grandis]
MTLETDCSVLVETICHNELPPWEIRALIEECPNLRIVHCRRQMNKVADRAIKAHQASSLPADWVFNPPLFLRELLSFDLMQNTHSTFR